MAWDAGLKFQGPSAFSTPSTIQSAFQTTLQLAQPCWLRERENCQQSLDPTASSAISIITFHPTLPTCTVWLVSERRELSAVLGSHGKQHHQHQRLSSTLHHGANLHSLAGFGVKRIVSNSWIPQQAASLVTTFRLSRMAQSIPEVLADARIANLQGFSEPKNCCTGCGLFPHRGRWGPRKLVDFFSGH